MIITLNAYDIIHIWDETKFQELDTYWEREHFHIHNHRKLLDKVGKQLNLKSYEDWYSVTTKQVRTLGKAGILNRYNGSLSKLLSTVYPEYPIKVLYVEKWK